MVPQKHRPITYIAPLDGLRAIAIIAVYLYHVYPPALSGGFTGVDVFYVLSGFLITSIILEDVRADRFSLAEFYLRRIQRLLPNAALTVCVTLGVWAWVMLPSQVVQTARHGLWALFNLSNIYTWMNLGDYWGNAAEWAPLTHTWSLGVEEQFYLLYPGALIALVRFQSKRIQPWLILAAIGSFAAYVITARTHPLAAFYLLPTRIWELLLGANLAVRRSQRVAPFDGSATAASVPTTRTLDFLGFGGLALVVIGFVAIRSGSGFLGIAALAPTIGTAMVLLGVTESDTRLGRWLATPFMVTIGKLSYSLYLWHWPAITLGKYFANVYGFSPLLGAVAGGVAGVGLAWAAYFLVEQPLRKRGAGRGWRIGTIATGFATVVLFGLVLSHRYSAPGVAQDFERPAFYGKLYDCDLRTDGKPTAAIRYSDVYFPPFEPRSDALWKTGGVVHLYGANQPQVVVLGSSHALMYSRLVDDICREKSLSVAFLGAGGTSLFFDDNGEGSTSAPATVTPFDAARRKFLNAWHPEVIIAIDRWDARFETPPGFDGRLRRFLQEVCPLTGRVVFVAQIPVAERGEQENLREVIGRKMESSPGGLPPALRVDPGEPLRRQAVAKAETMAREFPCLRVLRVDRLFYRRDGTIRYADGKRFYYADDDHLSDLGSEQARTLFTNAIMEAHAAGAGNHRRSAGVRSPTHAVGEGVGQK